MAEGQPLRMETDADGLTKVPKPGPARDRLHDGGRPLSVRHRPGLCSGDGVPIKRKLSNGARDRPDPRGSSGFDFRGKPIMIQAQKTKE